MVDFEINWPLEIQILPKAVKKEKKVEHRKKNYSYLVTGADPIVFNVGMNAWKKMEYVQNSLVIFFTYLKKKNKNIFRNLCKLCTTVRAPLETRGLYTFYPLFEVQKHFFQGAFKKKIWPYV